MPHWRKGWQIGWGDAMTKTLEYDHEAIKALLEEATFSLLRENVKISFCTPARDGLIGEAYKEKDCFAINLLPTLALEELYEVWLHEVGHIYHGHCDELEPRDLSWLGSKAVSVLETGRYLPKMTQEELQTYKESDAELVADNFARALDHVVRMKAYDKFFTTEVSVEVLLGLLKKITIQPDPNRKRTK